MPNLTLFGAEQKYYQGQCYGLWSNVDEYPAYNKASLLTSANPWN